ncbi:MULTISPECIES: dihydrolipoyllysine-residue acetyltransferase [Nitrincola]|uniref:Acetyltransferase component of pyruvate dehydrogenase complex n=1 Tax=Nitrincola nitratireducens TaxID=1229521 RepID=W9UWQ5_9GAMM|nr:MULTISPECIES: dihydrolipoyllysine-residue acetyltransferase [Nitrincola]EXJ11673.1 Dihydrolipoyllysine-residue acetyltransferase component of pyruvate dehydrogenase complex [Nitrincola nitratireducens]
MSKLTVTIPDLSGASDVDVIEVLVKVGDRVNEGDSLIALETDKASMEVPSTASGVITAFHVKEGDQVNEGDLLLELEVESSAAPEVSVAKEDVKEPVVVAPVASPAPVAASTSVEKVLIPDLSGASDVDVIEVLVKVGDSVNEGDSLITLETDKASMEVPAPSSGVIKALHIKEGDKVNEGDLLIELESASATVATVAAVAEATVPSAVTTEAAPAPAAAVVSSDVQSVLIPDLSGASDVDVIEVLVKEGDSINEGDSLITLETDKASMEVPAPFGGVITSMKIKVGDKVNEGDLLLEVEVKGAASVATVAASPAPAPAPAASAPSAQAPSVAKTSAPVDLANLEKSNRQVHAGPAVRALAREFGVDLSRVTGTGSKGRILKEDVQLYVKTTLKQLSEKPQSAPALASGSGIPAIPAVDFSKFGEIEMVKLNKIDKVTRDNMSRCWLNIPHVTQFDDADITALEAFRKEVKDEALKSGVKLTPLPFLIKACAIALKRHQKFNASLHADGEHIVYKKYVNIGLAVDTPNGLMVPVIKDADQKSVYELSKESVELAGKAKDRKLKPNEMQGACFTISSLGGIGGKGFTPIVNAPEVAILGVSKADIQPRWNGKEFEPRLMLPLCLSYDHRAINGGDAGRFLTDLNALLSDIRRLLL